MSVSSFLRSIMLLGLMTSSFGIRSARAETRVGLGIEAFPEADWAIGPHGAMRTEAMGVGVHLDFHGLYSRGPMDELVEFIEIIDDGNTDCATELPSFWSGQTTVEGRAVLGLGLVHLRGGLSTALQRGLSGAFMEYIATECDIFADGGVRGFSAGPTLGVMLAAGPVELTIDTIFRAGLWGSDPYQWVDPPRQERWVRTGRDYISPVLDFPVRTTLSLGPAYLQLGANFGFELPSANQRLYHEQDPEGTPEPGSELHNEIILAAGARF